VDAQKLQRLLERADHERLKLLETHSIDRQAASEGPP
jgi:hypothetical protein